MSDRGTIDEQIHNAKYGMSILVTCLVQELEAIHPGFTEKYEERLSRAYYAIRERETKAMDAMELISWTRELLTGFSMTTGQGKPFPQD